MYHFQELSSDFCFSILRILLFYVKNWGKVGGLVEHFPTDLRDSPILQMLTSSYHTKDILGLTEVSQSLHPPPPSEDKINYLGNQER